MRLSPGTKLGHYEIQSPIGVGGMGEVYLGKDQVLRRKVAIKVLPESQKIDPRAEERMLREARAAATLDHPNICSIYEVGHGEGFLFIAMQFLEGQPLDEKISSHELTIPAILAISTQLADALTEAHSKGIIHRDIKPANIMLNSRGDVKLMDFGLAKLELNLQEIETEAETAAQLSTPGHLIGTVPYMSPEQVRGRVVDQRSDLFSLGVVIYEMISGHRPFAGESPAVTGAAILTLDPPTLTRFVKDLSPELRRIVEKLLHKDPDDRYQSARDLLIDLRTLRDEIEFRNRLERSESPDGIAPTIDQNTRFSSVATQVRPVLTERQKQRTAEVSQVVATGPASQRSNILRVGAFVLVAVIAAGGWWMRERSNQAWAREQLPRIEELSKTGNHFAAFDLAADVRKYLPDDPTLLALTPNISTPLSVSTEPTGAAVYLKRYDADASGKFPDRVLIGTTPIADIQIPRGPHILYIEKEGFAPVLRSALGPIIRNGTITITSPPLRIEQKLLEAGAMPDKMAAVPGGDYRLVAWERPTEDRVRLDDFFIDKYEVSNQDYKEFINAGGYSKKEFWKVPFVKEGVAITWEAAMALFKDRTGLSAPRTWSNQNFPDGKGDHPVTDISWYEASAYAAYRGKALPTVFQWEKAARDGQANVFGTFMPWGFFSPGDSMKERANFENNGTQPVVFGEFGVSPFGSYNMAGNVSEWTVNETADGMIATGGSWGDPEYTYGKFGAFPPLFSSEKRGFRCVLNSPSAQGDQGAAKIEKKDEVPEYTAISDADFAKLTDAYRYEKRALDPRVDEVIDTPEWRREKISFNGAGGERAFAYLYLPRHAPRPLQVIHFIPGGDVEYGLRSLTASAEDRLGSIIKSGRAVFGVITKGYVERLRPEGFVWPDRTTAEYRDMIVERIADVSIGVDYLVSRDDIDAKRIALYGPSAGSRIGLILAALEDRYAGVYFMGAGITKTDLQTIREASPINFAPHIRAPKYILNGRYDEDTPMKTQCEPLFKLFREPKKLEIFEGGHVPSSEILVPSLNKFLDETLGPMKSG